MLAITMTAYRRPDYTREVLRSLAACHGVEDCSLLVNCEPGYDETIEAIREFDACEMSLVVNKRRRGLNINTNRVLDRAANRIHKRPEFAGVLHIEDDTVLAPDALDYFLWGLRTFGHHRNVFSISGYNKPNNEPTAEQQYKARVRKWFTCWGWAVTRERLIHILLNWCTRNPKSFAWHVNRNIRKQKLEIHPQLSRVQNIGYKAGENGRSPEWYEANHRTPWMADCDPGEWSIHAPKNKQIQKLGDEANR